MRRIFHTGLIALALLAISCNSCGDTPYKKLARGYRATNTSARFAEELDRAFAQYLLSTQKDCKQKYGVKTKEYDACVLPALRIVRAWTGKKSGKTTGKGVLPALQDAQRAVRLALDAAYDYVKSHEKECKKDDAPPKCTGDWQKLLRSAVCPTVLLVDRAIKIGAFSTTQSATYKTIMTFTNAAGGCK